MFCVCVCVSHSLCELLSLFCYCRHCCCDSLCRKSSSQPIDSYCHFVNQNAFIHLTLKLLRLLLLVRNRLFIVIYCVVIRLDFVDVFIFSLTLSLSFSLSPSGWIMWILSLVILLLSVSLPKHIYKYCANICIMFPFCRLYNTQYFICELIYLQTKHTQ